MDSEQTNGINAGLPQRWSRVLILETRPQVDCGRFPAKRALDERLEVTADIVADGHEIIAAEVAFGPAAGRERTTRMSAEGNDLFRAVVEPDLLGIWRYRVRAWIDAFATWQELFERRLHGGSPKAELDVELREGAALLRKALARAADEAAAADRGSLEAYIEAFEAGEAERALEPELLALASRHDPQEGAVEGETLELLVERPLARNSSWYEFFPRSLGPGGRHGTLDDAAAHLDYVKSMGFDVVYLPPIHPIGRSHRKGKDNAPTAGPSDPGSPWAIGNEDGGHKSVAPELGGLEAFDRFMARARELGLEVALDLALQCSPDHPYVREHPEWFRHRQDGSIRYAENPPKKYQDIYPIDFESRDWRGLWTELRSIVEFWAERGVRTFRVDNPHTKPLRFWEWCFGSLRRPYPDLVFLAEAFTRPKVMYALGKVGFSQSYTYFTWRYSPQEFREYLRELFHTGVSDFFRPNFWPNTPDILPPYLRDRATFQARLVLAATLSASYGVYGPAFELLENEPHPAREEYRNNEKYELRSWDLGHPRSLRPLLERVNRIRRENPALHHNVGLRFHEVDDEQLLAYSKRSGDNAILVVVSFDPSQRRSARLELDLGELGLSEGRPYMLHDLLDDRRIYWQGSANRIEIDPKQFPARIFRVARHLRRENDFDYFM